jgi:hypothetical protein
MQLLSQLTGCITQQIIELARYASWDFIQIDDLYYVQQILNERLTAVTH